MTVNSSLSINFELQIAAPLSFCVFEGFLWHGDRRRRLDSPTKTLWRPCWLSPYVARVQKGKTIRKKFFLWKIYILGYRCQSKSTRPAARFGSGHRKKVFSRAGDSEVWSDHHLLFIKVVKSWNHSNFSYLLLFQFHLQSQQIQHNNNILKLCW